MIGATLLDKIFLDASALLRSERNSDRKGASLRIVDARRLNFLILEMRNSAEHVALAIKVSDGIGYVRHSAPAKMAPELSKS